MTQHRPPTQLDRWSLAEAADLPLALEEERYSPDREKDLALAREEIARVADPAASEDTNDRAALHAWIRRWQSKGSGHTPGEWLVDVLKNAGRIALGAGILLGLVSASDRLFFTPPEPLNVFFLIGVFVLAPLLLTATLLLTAALRRPGAGNFLQHIFLAAARKVTRGAHPWHRQGEEELRANPTWSTIAKSLGRNSTLLQAPMLGVTQKLALGFGIGLLIMLQLRVSFWELAFGWQTTLTAPGEVWHLFTRAIAAPWSWFWPEGSPTLEQINATRYSKLPGAPHIDPAASRAWWPFLFATIFVWSVLVRVGILAVLRGLQNRRLAAFDPLTPDAQLLARRLRPHWSASVNGGAHAAIEESSTASSLRDKAQGAWFAFVADETDATMPRAEDVPAMFGVTPQQAFKFAFDDSEDGKTVAALAALRGAAASVLVLVPVSRDPIDEVHDTLGAIASASRGATLVLCGPTERLAVWKRKLGEWGLGIGVEYIRKP